MLFIKLMIHLFGWRTNLCTTTVAMYLNWLISDINVLIYQTTYKYLKNFFEINTTICFSTFKYSNKKTFNFIFLFIKKDWIFFAIIKPINLSNTINLKSFKVSSWNAAYLCYIKNFVIFQNTGLLLVIIFLIYYLYFMIF